MKLTARIGTMNNNMYKFKGGIRAGLLATSWPFCSLEINEEMLLLRNGLLKQNYTFLRSQIEHIEVKKVLPIIGHGIKIYPKEKMGGSIYFWTWKKSLDELLIALEKLKYPIKAAKE